MENGIFICRLFRARVKWKNLRNIRHGAYIGIKMAKKCKDVYRMKILYNNRHKQEEVEKELNACYVSFDELLNRSDIMFTCIFDGKK